MELEVYKKSDFYEDYIDSQKEYYERTNADAYFAEQLAEKDKEIAELQETNVIIANNAVRLNKMLDEKDKEITELKQKLEDVNDLIKTARKMLEDAQATAYTESVDANMEIRRLKRALWLARAEWARSSALSYHLIESHPDKDAAATYKRKANKWEKAKDKCLKKAEEYK